MKNKITVGALVTLALTAGWSSEASASFPVAVWTHVDKVVLDNPADPTTIEIHGTFMLHTGETSTKYFGFSEPAKGYLYYTCPAGQKAICQMEWADLQKNIGKPVTECAGFGGDMSATGTLRQSCDPPSKPDIYPIAMGVVGGFSPCQVIGEFLTANPGNDGCGGAGGGSSSSSSGNTTTSSAGNTTTGSAGNTTTGSAGNTTTGSAGNTTGGSSGGSNSEGFGGCTIEAAREGAGLGGLALAAAFGGLALRRKPRRPLAR
jgi:hypothetical protein